MLKRIGIIAFFTGSGQLLSLFVLKYVSGNVDVAQLKSIAEIDSLVFFIMNLLALGLQPTAMRNLALATHWKQEYYDTQSARITLGLILMCGALLFFLNPFYLVFLLAPVLAWSGDYALYARGYPVAGSIIAFVRLVIPFSAVLIAAFYNPAILGWVYLISLAIVYFLTNAYISYYLKTAYVFVPSLHNLPLYVHSLPLGIVAVSLYFLGLGLVLIIPYFYLPAVVAVAFLGLKLYVIFKGVFRIIHQAFIKEMMSYEVCFKVDQLCSLMGILFASMALCFPQAFTKLFFGEKYLPDIRYFGLLALAGLFYSLFSSLTTKAMLEKKDRPYAVVAGLSALLTIILSIIFSFDILSWSGSNFPNPAEGIALSLLIGELCFIAGMLWLMNKPGLIRQRMMFLAMNIPLLLISLGIRYFFGDHLTAFLLAAVITAGVMMTLYFRRFSRSLEK